MNPLSSIPSRLSGWIHFTAGLLFVPLSATADLDFGDAPSSYPVTLAQNGARHQIVSEFNLGTDIDSETNGLPNAIATGDDLDNADDEDGVAFGTLKQRHTSALTVSVTDDSGMGGFVDAWCDYNGSGNWETNEHLFNGAEAEAEESHREI